MKNIEKVSLSLTIVISLVIQTSHAAEDQDAAKLAKASKLIDSRKPKPAALLLRQIIRSNPNNAEAHMQLGAALAALAENEKYDEAISEEQLAIKLDPSSSGAHRMLGMIYSNQKKLDESIVELTEACKLKPSSFAAQRDLSTAYAAAGKIDDAILTLKKAVELKPDNFSVHMKLASLYVKKDNLIDAVAEANKAIEFGGKRAEPHLLLANIKLDSGDSASSIEPFKSAIAANGYDSLGCLNPLTAASAFSGLGWALASSKDATKETRQEALLYQKKAIKAYPGFLNAHIRQAELLSMQNRPKDAELAYQNLFKASAQRPTVGIAYAKFLKNAGRTNEARDILKKAIETHPDDKSAAEALAAMGPATAK